MVNKAGSLRHALLWLFVPLVFTGGYVFAEKTGVPTPKEYGIYAKTIKGLKRIIPNIVLGQGSMAYIESNNPQRFTLGEVQYFVVYGTYQIQFLTLNNLLPLNQSAIGRPRFILGKEVATDVKKEGSSLYVVKPKGLFGRGYYAIWIINDATWDFIVE